MLPLFPILTKTTFMIACTFVLSNIYMVPYPYPHLHLHVVVLTGVYADMKIVKNWTWLVCRARAMTARLYPYSLGSLNPQTTTNNNPFANMPLPPLPIDIIFVQGTLLTFLCVCRQWNHALYPPPWVTICKQHWRHPFFSIQPSTGLFSTFESPKAEEANAARILSCMTLFSSIHFYS